MKKLFILILMALSLITFQSCTECPECQVIPYSSKEVYKLKIDNNTYTEVVVRTYEIDGQIWKVYKQFNDTKIIQIIIQDNNITQPTDDIISNTLQQDTFFDF